MKRLIYITILLLLIQSAGWSQGPLHFFTEGRLYFSGDAVRMILVPMKEDGTLGTDDSRIRVSLLNALGTVMHTEEYLVTDLGKDGVFLLPEELSTGNYRLIASYGEKHYQVPLHIYEPSVLTSLQLPNNLDPELGPDSMALPVSGGLEFMAGSEGSYMVENSPAIVKVFENRNAAFPGVGQEVATVDIDLPTRYKIETISSHPDARVSIYFVDQRMVEEHYVDELEWLNLRMGRHYGESRIWAFQFDEKGNKLGPVPIEIQKPSIPSFARASDAVPFNQGVRNFLEEKKNRKFIDQVYGKPLIQFQHYAAEVSENPDISVSADEYTGLASLEEVITTIVPKAQVVKRGKSTEIRLVPSNSGYRYPEGPLVLVNGLPETRLDSLLEVPARHVKLVEVYNSIESQRQYGTLGRFGVIDITLKPEAEFEPTEDLPWFKGINDLEVQRQGDFESPDLRPDLLWKYLRPGVSEINWKNTDVAGDYIIWIRSLQESRDVVIPVSLVPELR